MQICKRSLFLMLIIVFSLLISACSNSNKETEANGEAKEYPDKDITLIVHTSPGGPTDGMARKVAEIAEPILGQEIIVENKPGGDGATQMEELMRGDSDGYTLGAMTPTQIGALNSNLKEQYSLEDFTFISGMQEDPYVLAVNTDSDFKTLEDLTDYMKKNPDEVKIGGHGSAGSGQNVAWNIFADAADVEGEWVNYDSSGDAVTALLGNHVDVANTNPGKVSEHVESDDLRVLGVFRDERLEDMPDVPTYEEEGYPIDVDWFQYRGIYANSEVPEEVVDKLDDVFKEVMESDEFKEYMEKNDIEIADLQHEEFTSFIEEQSEINKEWLDKLGIE